MPDNRGALSAGDAIRSYQVGELGHTLRDAARAATLCWLFAHCSLIEGCLSTRKSTTVRHYTFFFRGHYANFGRDFLRICATGRNALGTSRRIAELSPRSTFSTPRLSSDCESGFGRSDRLRQGRGNCRRPDWPSAKARHLIACGDDIGAHRFATGARRKSALIDGAGGDARDLRPSGLLPEAEFSLRHNAKTISRTH